MTVERTLPILRNAATSGADGLRRAGSALRRPTGFGIAVTAVALVAAAANLARLGLARVTFDEPLYAAAAWRYVHGDTGPIPSGRLSTFDNYEHPPFAKYLFGLAQLVAGHSSVTADRAVAGVCTLATALILGLWLGRLTNRWIGLGAAALLALLPMRAAGQTFRFARYGYLDPVAELFAVGAVILAWEWFRRDGRAAWWFAGATGVCAGLAAASKENGFLGVIGCVVLGMAVTRRRREAVGRLLQAAAAAGISLSVFVLSYLPLGRSPFAAIRYLLHVQRLHADVGHSVTFAGRTSDHPPAWAFLWFAAHGLGAVVTVFAVLAAATAVALRHDRLVLWCCAALIGPVVFHMAIAGVILGYYWVMWMPAFLALVALGIAELAKRVASSAPTPRIAGVSVALSCAIVFAVPSVRATYRVLTISTPRPMPYAAAVMAYTPLVYLRLDDAAGSTATDWSGNERTGAYVGSPRLDVRGLLTNDPDPATAFSGFGDSVQIRGSSWMDASSYTVIIWFSSGHRSSYLVARDDYLAGKVWNLQLGASGHLRFVTYSSFGGHGQNVTSGKRYDDRRAHMAVCVKDGRTMLLYVDGALSGKATWPTYARSTSLGISLAHRGSGGGNFAGTLDEFTYYDRALTAGDVLALYRAGADVRAAVP